MYSALQKDIAGRKTAAVARAISLVENEVPGYDKLLASFPLSAAPIIGITGSPGAGKSTITNALVAHILSQDKTVAVVCVDPSSPFNMGAILGDRIRMGSWYGHQDVYIRSVATRGALGGLSHKIIEITDVLRAANFDYIIVETVGIGQSEIDIAGLADVTVVVVVPEGGDDVQAMKSGVMEVGDIFVLNKADRPGADNSLLYLQQMISPAMAKEKPTPIIKMVATKDEGVGELYAAISTLLAGEDAAGRKGHLLAEKAWQLLQAKKMSGVDKTAFNKQLSTAASAADFNLYDFIASF